MIGWWQTALGILGGIVLLWAVLGYADDALMVAIALRFATRHAGSVAIERHWPGTPQGRAAGLATK